MKCMKAYTRETTKIKDNNSYTNRYRIPGHITKESWEMNMLFYGKEDKDKLYNKFMATTHK